MAICGAGHTRMIKYLCLSKIFEKREIRNIWAVGRNYADHAKELNNQIPSANETPIIFLKAGSSLTREQNIQTPPDILEVHHEIEIAVQLDYPPSFGLRRFRNHKPSKQLFGALKGSDPCPIVKDRPQQNLLVPTRIFLALDLTDRLRQNALKEKGLPWTLAKSFRNACPLSKASFELTHPEDPNLEELRNLEISLTINGILKQKGSTQNLIFSIPKLVQFVQGHLPVAPGDLILTGTPAGVGPLHHGDILTSKIDRLGLNGTSQTLIQSQWNFV